MGNRISIRFKSISWKEGIGTTLLGMFIIMACFFVVLMIINMSSIYNETVRAQTIVDAVADGSAVYAQTALDLNETALREKANEIIDENNATHKSIKFSIDNLSVDDYAIQSRSAFQDKKITLTVKGKSRIITNYSNNKPKFTIKKRAIIVALSRVPTTYELNEHEMAIVSNALAQVPANSPQAKMIIEGLRYLGWNYSMPCRWSQGFRDCSAFVLSTTRNADTGERYTHIFDANPHGYTVTMWQNASSNHALVNHCPCSLCRNPAVNLDELIPGDILFFDGAFGRGEGRAHGLSHTALYLGNYKGTHYMVDAGSSAGGVTIRPITCGGGKILAHVRIPDESQVAQTP